MKDAMRYGVQVPAVMESGDVEERMSGGWETALDAYIAQKDCMETSLCSYRKGLAQFFRWVDRTGRNLATLTEADIKEWKRDLLETGHAVKTVKLYVNSLKGFYEWTESKLLYPNIAKSVKADIREGGRVKFVKMHLDDTQGTAFLRYFLERGRLRDYAMMNLMIRTGVRSIEVNRANIEDIQCKNGRTVLFIQGKGHFAKDEFVVLSDKVLDPIGEYLATRPGALAGSPLFACEGRNCMGRRLSTRTIQSIGKEGMRAIGLNGHAYSVHSLRHTAGVQILKNGGTQFDVQDVLRHSSPVTSQIYLESIKEERRIESAPEMILDKSFNI